MIPLQILENLYVVVDIMSVINKETIKIKSIELDEARLNFVVLKSGKANWDIAKVDTTQVESTCRHCYHQF